MSRFTLVVSIEYRTFHKQSIDSVMNQLEDKQITSHFDSTECPSATKRWFDFIVVDNYGNYVFIKMFTIFLISETQCGIKQFF